MKPHVENGAQTHAAHEAGERYRSLVESAGFGIALTDFRGKFTFVNKALCRMIGYSEELTGRHFSEFLHPEDKQRILKVFMNAWKNPLGSRSIEFRVAHKSGHAVHMFSTPTLYRHNGKIMGFNAIIADITRMKQMEEAIKNLAKFPDDDPFPVLRLNNEGAVTYTNKAAQVLLKISGERTLTERKRIEEQRVKLEKMATVGELATMVAHDLRNPLTSIRNASFYMKSTCESLRGKGVQPLLEMADLIEQEIIYANNIINDLLEFAAKKTASERRT